ncbi:SMP-30/gluconolactonase/LRE family protein [Rhodococcus sp. MEB064]|uniref:SMP-30/gluconolactonase/LRE family protein n=1 Tax=Rhodococcus sp. MEB064 TaxID=1587522 RepID=UPI0012E09A23|nr:hypothetical protein [Rhodococcus sp. MEB064]
MPVMQAVRALAVGAAAVMIGSGLVAGAGSAGAEPVAPPSPAPGDARTFAELPLPGQPEGIAVDPRDGSVWTGSNRPRSAGAVWHHDRSGALIGTYDLVDHSPSAEHGVNGIALDGAGRAYALDYSGARAVRIDPATGEQSVYATFPDLPSCGRGVVPCEPSPIDRPAWPNYPVFDGDGNMYVSDLNQATIWKVAPGGGEARIWYQSADFASIYSVNGMQFDAQGRLVFAVTISLTPDASIFRGKLFRLGVEADGSPGTREQIATTSQGDGIAIGSSGRIYVAVANPVINDVEVVEPGRGVVDALPSPLGRSMLSVPLVTPASLAFRGTSLLATNHSQYALDPREWSIQELGVDEGGLPLFHPTVV